MNSKRSRYLTILLIFSMIFTVATGCSGGGQEKPSPQENQKKAPEVPEILSEMEKGVLEIMYALDMIPGLEKALAQVEQQKVETEVESEVKQSKEEKDTMAKKEVKPKRFIAEENAIINLLEEEEVKSDIVKDDQLPSEIDEAWFQIQRIFYLLHRQWNVLEVHLKDGGVSTETIELGKQAVNQSTLAVNEKDWLQSLFSLNSLMYYLSLYRSHFVDKIPHEIFQLRYTVREACLLAYDQRYDEASMMLNQAMELVNQLRPSLIEKGAKSEVQKLEFSLKEMQEEGNLKEYNLLKIKGTVTMKNIALVTAPFESQMK